MDLIASVDTPQMNRPRERKQLRYLEQGVKRDKYVIEFVDFEPSSPIPVRDAAKSSSHPARNNETHDHVHLKAAAAQYFRETGSKPVFEQPSWFGVADVGIEAETRFAECGTVRTGKFIEAFGRESSLNLLGEENPAYRIADELVYLPYTGNTTRPPYKMIRIQRRD